MNKEKILVLWSSVMEKNKSFSYELLTKFIEHHKNIRNNKEDEYIFIDLNNEKVGIKTLTNTNIGAFFADKDCDKYINQLKSMNKLIIATPMINFNIPTTLKNYLDHIFVPDKTFSYKYSKQGDAIGLLNNLRVQILVTQGAPINWYKWGNLAEYLKGTWEFAGANVNEVLVVAGTKIPENKDKTPEKLIKEYENQIKKVAEKF